MEKQENIKNQNTFLESWIYGKLSCKELNEFTRSENYKNLVQSKIYKS